MSWNFQQIQVDVQNDADNVASSHELEAFRIKYLGKKGLIPKIYASMGILSKEERPLVGKNANDLRNHISQILEGKKQEIKQKEKLSTREDLDVTIPGARANLGHRHILTQTIESICQIFVQMGFVIQEGPEIETEFNNFEALNIPIDHPSRDAFDTFYLETPDPQQKERYLLLRSQTSPGQIRTMQQYDPPFAVVIPGKVYRPDAVDASHSFMFHQIEGLYVARDVKMSDLKGLLTVFCKKFFGNDIKMRFRPHFFPFTEPSAEVDISCYICGGKGCSVCGRKGWLEIMGCGMVHPCVFEAVNYPKGKYTGLAFGLGVERIAMLKHGIHDIRIFYENDNRFLNQF
ncbi:MAG: phenylalanine--tRNA ligase subunit alpha [Candidatus Omnitrophica bacterium]|nr:phenylalanine--tRNA ligase subunit alpha [Candidatus Omnitrophota bacterium]